MDLARKIELVEQQMKSIATHDDEPLEVVSEALFHLEKSARAFFDEMSKRRTCAIAEKIKALKTKIQPETE